MMKESHTQSEEPVLLGTNAVGNVLIDLDTLGDTTLRPSRFKKPSAKDAPVPAVNGQTLDGEKHLEA